MSQLVMKPSLPIIKAVALSDPGTMLCGTPRVKASLWFSSESSFLQILNSPTEPQPVEKPMWRTCGTGTASAKDLLRVNMLAIYRGGPTWGGNCPLLPAHWRITDSLDGCRP